MKRATNSARVDTTTPPNHDDLINRLTTTLPDDLYAMARSHAVAKRISISKAIGDLLQERLHSAHSTSAVRRSAPSPGVHPLSGFPIVEGGSHPITSEDVRRAEDDEDVRHLEGMGLSPESIERGLAR